MDKQKIIAILNSEMELATGCTEPAAIALTAAYARRQLGAEPGQVRVLASGNIIKNAMAAGIPGTKYTGIEYASAIGAAGGDPDRQLQVIDGVGGDAFALAEQLVRGGKVTVEVAPSTEKLYIDVTVAGGGHTGRAVIARNHTNLILLQRDGETSFEKPLEAQEASSRITPEEIMAAIDMATIYQFVCELDTQKDPIDIIHKSIEINSAISDEGLVNDYGLKIGKNIRQDKDKGLISDDMISRAMEITSAGADARMAGAPLTVVSNSGSGNQGITCTMPVVAVARWLDAGSDRMVRAVTLSNLTAIYIKSKFGRLSALCGATVAATGAACGVTYLLGGDFKAITYAVQNMIGNVAGMLCDGAKADCALKICTCTNAALHAALMAVKGLRVSSTDGIVEEDVEKTIDNFTTLGNQGSVDLDKIILGMMLSKGKQG